MSRIIGLETEYGCLLENPEGSRGLLGRIRDWVFDQGGFGLIDLHQRDWDEPPHNGGFLYNGGRLYVDMGHMEFCTPECASAGDVVLYDRAGDRLLLRAVEELRLQEEVSFIRNNIDHYTGATFGCHENYSLQRSAPLTETNVLSLLAFLTLRTLLCGAGRVGNIKGNQSEGAPQRSAILFQISQRADYIQNDFFEWVQHNRAIINTRDEPLADPMHYRRLHLLHGDANVLPSALYLKAGMTRLALDLLEEDALPKVALHDAVIAMRHLSRKRAGPWRVRLVDGSEADALELLDLYRSKAQEHFKGRDTETDAVLSLWKMAVEALAESRKQELVGLIDWVTKEFILEEFRQSEGLEWNDPWLEAQDLEYHHIDPTRSLGMALANTNGPWHFEDSTVLDALSEAPADTRAKARSCLMREIELKGGAYVLDWDEVEIPDEKRWRLPDPFQTQIRS